MKKSPARQPLTNEQIKRCHKIVDDLVRLHTETIPAAGAEKGKNEKAYQALSQVGMLSAILTEWAESHVMGTFYAMGESKEKWLSDKDADKHNHELRLYGQMSPFPENEDALIYTRVSLATILKNNFRLYGPTGWRMALSESLYALNDGQVDWLLKPTNTNLKGNAYDLSNLKWAAINHVYKLMGEGWKKTAAQQKVAECCGTTFEAIKKWENQEAKVRDKDKIDLKGMQRGAQAIKLFRESPDYNEQELLIVAANQSIKTDLKSEKDKKNKDFFCDITFCFRLEQLHPLDTLGERLREAGFRKAE